MFTRFSRNELQSLTYAKLKNLANYLNKSAGYTIQMTNGKEALIEEILNAFVVQSEVIEDVNDSPCSVRIQRIREANKRRV